MQDESEVPGNKTAATCPLHSSLHLFLPAGLCSLQLQESLCLHHARCIAADVTDWSFQ